MGGKEARRERNNLKSKSYLFSKNIFPSSREDVWSEKGGKKQLMEGFLRRKNAHTRQEPLDFFLKWTGVLLFNFGVSYFQNRCRDKTFNETENKNSK